MTYNDFLTELQTNRRYLLAIAHRILKEESDAKDLLQDQIEEWLKSKEWLKVTTSFRGWFGNRIRSRARNVLKRRGTIKISIDAVSRLEMLIDNSMRKCKSVFPTYAPNYLEPNVEQLWDELKGSLELSIKDLSKHDKMIIHKLYFEGKTISEVAKELNLPRMTFYGRKVKILKKLKKVLEDKFDDYERGKYNDNR